MLAFSTDVPGNFNADGILSRSGTPIDPTSRFSFLNYLKSNARLEQFFCSSGIYPSRREFEDYFNWVATQIADIVFAVNVNSVDYDPETNLFVVHANPQSTYASKHIVLGYGAEPRSSVEPEPEEEGSGRFHSSLIQFSGPLAACSCRGRRSISSRVYQLPFGRIC